MTPYPTFQLECDRWYGLNQVLHTDSKRVHRASSSKKKVKYDIDLLKEMGIVGCKANNTPIEHAES